MIMCGVTDGQRELVTDCGVRVNDVKGFPRPWGIRESCEGEAMKPHKVVPKKAGFSRIACGPCDRGRSGPELCGRILTDSRIQTTYNSVSIPTSSISR